MPPARPPADYALQRSSRDAGEARARLEAWLATVLPAGARPRITLRGGVDANGMSSETVVLDVDWTHDGAPQHGEYVARVAPSQSDIPVFPEYRLGEQYRAMRLARELSGVPVPQVRWLEPTGEVLGTPFFLMDRVSGEVPPDVLPYTFGDNWLFDATADQQQTLQRTTVEAIAKLHGIPDAAERFDFLDPQVAGHDGATLLARNLARTRAWYQFGAEGLGRSPLVERGFAWLTANLPSVDDVGESVLCWGDSRIGNVMYDDFVPVAVLDWEVATLGPREMDLGWLVFAHRVFQGIAEAMDQPGMPDLLRADDVRATYAELSDGEVIDVTPERWVGTRDRSWGIRPVGEAPSPGRPAEPEFEGMWWLYVPMQFDDFAVVLIIQEEPDGYRTLNDCHRVFRDGRVEQLGWPAVDIRYAPGTREPTGATIRCTTPDGSPFVLEVESLLGVPIHVGGGYGGDSDWSHGVWKGEKFTERLTYSLTDPDVAGRVMFGVIDHVGRAVAHGDGVDGAEGWGLFEHGALGRHDPSGFTDWFDLAK